MKTIVAILIFILPCSLTAQLKKGQWLVGGIGDFAHTSSEQGNDFFSNDREETNFRFMPGAGYFFMDRFCGGLRINISSQKTNTDQISYNPAYSYIASSDITASGIGLSPFVRYYFLPAAKKINIFADGSYTYNSETTKSALYQKTIISGGTPVEISNNSKDKFKGNYYSLAVGPAILIGKNVSFELSLGYTVGKIKDLNQTNGQLSFGTGFQVYFGK